MKLLPKEIALYKKRSFSLRISSINVTISVDSCGFGHVYLRNPQWKTSFNVQSKDDMGCKKKKLAQNGLII